MLKKHGQILLSILYINDSVIALLSWMLAYHVRFSSGLFPVEEAPPLRYYTSALPLIALIWPVVFNISKLYLPKRNVSLWSEFYGIFKAGVIATFILICLSFFFYREYSYSRVLICIFFALSLLLIILSRMVIRSAIRYLRRKGRNLKNVIIVGAGDLGRRVAQKMSENPWAGFNLVGWIDDYRKAGEDIEGRAVLGNCAEINRCIGEGNVDQVFIALPVRAYNRLLYVLKKLEEETVDVRIVPNIYQAVTLNASIEDFDGLPTINITESPIYGWSQAIKRLFDVTVSIIALVLTAPIILFTAILIKITSPGPAFFKQVRYGLGGKKVEVYKLRSMRVQDRKTSDSVQATRSDPRVTAVGRFIRRTSIDELPQFYNVFRGDMSIVGPRPHPLDLDEKNKSILDTYMWRYKVKPGITGWAQVNGWRGETDTLDKMRRRIEHDIYYIENWSPWFDIRIMWLTVWKGFVNKNAY